MANLFIDEEFLNNMANAIIKQNKAHSTIDGYTISNEGLNPQQFADAIRHLDVAPLKQRPIITADFGTTTHVGTIEYKPTNADCWGSITVNINEKERFKELIQPFATISDENLVKIVNAMDRGIITPEETGWKIGDERRVQLSAMNEMGSLVDNWNAQRITLVIMDSGHYELINGAMDHFVLGTKDCLDGYGKIDSSNLSDITWENCERRTWCNTVFRDAFPESLKSIFKQFKTIIADRNNNIIVLNDYFSLFAEGEIIDKNSNYYSPSNEINNLTQIEYYKTALHRFKTVYNSGYGWFTRSAAINSSSNTKNFCYITTSKKNSYTDASIHSYGIAPFGCI